MLNSCTLHHNVDKFARDNTEIRIKNLISELQIEIENFDTSKFYIAVLDIDAAKTLDPLLFTNINGLHSSLIKAFTPEDESITVEIDEDANMHFKWIGTFGKDQKEREFHIEMKEKILSPLEEVKRHLSHLPSCSLEQKRMLGVLGSMLKHLEMKEKAEEIVEMKMGALETRADRLETDAKIQAENVKADFCRIQESQNKILKFLESEEIVKAKKALKREENEKKDVVKHYCNKENDMKVMNSDLEAVEKKVDKLEKAIEVGNERLEIMMNEFKTGYESSIEQFKNQVMNQINQELNRPGQVTDVSELDMKLKAMVKQEIEAMRQDQEEKYAKLLSLVNGQGDERQKVVSAERRPESAMDIVAPPIFQHIQPRFDACKVPYLRYQNLFRDVESEKGRSVSQAIFGEKALPKKGKYYFSVKIKAFKKGEHSVLAVGIGIKKSEVPIILSQGSYFLNLLEKIAYLNGETGKHYGDAITLHNVVHVLVDGDNNTICFKVNDTLYFSGRIDAGSFGDGDFYPCIYTQTCTDLKLSFV